MRIDFKNIVPELKRRRVFRVAAVYSGFAFIVFQIIDATFDTLGIPNWLGKYTIVALILGFPIAVGLGWAFDITDKGVVRTRDKPIEQDSRKPFVGNISLTIVASIAIILAIWGWMKTPEVRSEGYQSVAVLPFDNYMGDATQDYFVDGMTEAIIAELARLEGLRVISRTSVMRYRDTELRLTDIAEELGVDAIVEGSVLKAGNEVRITAQLIDGMTDEHLWANSFDKNLDQVLSLQRDVASAIAEQIKWTFKPEEEEYFQQAEPVVNSDAYDLFLKGWQQRLLESPQAINKAVNYFEAATLLDSTLYQAHAAKIVTYYLETEDREKRSEKAKTALAACVRMAPEAPETQIALAMYNQLFELELSSARDGFMRALDMRPGDAELRREYGLFLFRVGQFEDAAVELEISRAYDPMSALTLRDLGLVKTRLGQGKEAHDLLIQSLEIDPYSLTTKNYLAASLLVLNRPDDSYEHYLGLRDTLKYLPAGMHLAAARSGNWDNYLVYIDSLSQGTDNGWIQFLNEVYTGSLDVAMISFTNWAGMQHPEFVNVHYTTEWDPVRHRPEFKQALKKFGFPQPFPESFSDLLNRLHGPVPKKG